MLLFDNILSKVDNIRTDLKGLGADISTFTKSKNTNFEVVLTGKKKGLFKTDEGKDIFVIKGEGKAQHKIQMGEDLLKKNLTYKDGINHSSDAEVIIEVIEPEEDDIILCLEEPKEVKEVTPEEFSFSNFPFIIELLTTQFNLSINDLESLEKNCELTLNDKKYTTHFKIQNLTNETKNLIITAIPKAKTKDIVVITYQFTKDGKINEFK